MIRPASALLVLGLALAGCASRMPDEPPQALPEPAFEQPPVAANGSIYQAGRDVRLYESRIARRVGDIITVVLEESTDASKDASQSLARSSSVDFPAPTIMGREVTKGGVPVEFGVEADQSFDGGGSADQSNALSGTLTAQVVRVQPNGNLVIEGQKKLTLNRGDEYVTISGVVRRDDLDADNTVSSTRVANARISYTGSGALADSSRMGWLSRLFMSVISPF